MAAHRRLIVVRQACDTSNLRPQTTISFVTGIFQGDTPVWIYFAQAEAIAGLLISAVALLQRDGSMCAIPVPFDPAEVFGKARAPVTVTLNGYTYRSTIFNMGGERFLPLRKSNREAAGLEGDETLSVTLTLDETPREVEVPKDLEKALKAAKVWDAWTAQSFTHKREHAEAVESAKKPETRARRIEKAVELVTAKAAKKR